MQPSAPATPPDGAAHRVLIADDAPDLRQLLCLLLSVEDDFEVVGEAGDGAAAVEAAAALQPDLVVLDLTMPVLDGLAALPRLRAAAPAARLVVFSGLGRGDALRPGGGQEEPDAWVEKGTGVLDLVDRLREVCRRPVAH